MNMNTPSIPDREARGPDLEAMIRQYGDGLLRMCFLYLRDVSLAEDAVQETFATAWAKYGSFAGRSSEKTWLTAIAANICRNMLRSAWRRHTTGPEALASFSVGGPDVPDSTVTHAILALPATLREVVTLHYYRGLKVGDIASLLKLPRPTVSSRLARAKKKLRNELKEWYFDED